jgi:hypothetical protein
MHAHLLNPSKTTRPAVWLGLRCMSPAGIAPAIG